MKILLPWLLCFLLSGCGTISWNKPEQLKKEEPVGVQILENNKEALTVIKNRTADDIELGYKTRSLEQKYESDEEFGKKVRAVVDKQVPESKKDLKKTTPTVLTLPQCQDINTRLNVLILIILVLNVVELTFLVISTFTRKDITCEKPNSKLARKPNDQTSND